MRFLIRGRRVGSDRGNLSLILSLPLFVTGLLSPSWSLAAVPPATTQVSKLCELRAGGYDFDQFDSGQQTYEQTTGCNLSVPDAMAEGNASAGFGPGVPWIGIATVGAWINVYNGIAESDYSANVQYQFEIRPTKVVPGTPPTVLPVLFGARGEGYSQRAGYCIARSVGVVHLYGDPLDYDDARFEFETYVVDEIAGDPIDEEYQEGGFDEMRPLDLYPNHTYGVVMSAVCELWAGPAGQNADASAQCSAGVDPFIGFDQARFDEMMGANTFPLNEYYAFVFSENLPESSKVMVMSPNGEEILNAGSTHRIEWLAPPEVVRFNLSYSEDNGATWKVIRKSVAGNFYDWTVPSPTNNRTRCLLKIVGLNGFGVKVGMDKSDTPFTIKVLTITSPQNGSTCTHGRVCTITWEKAPAVDAQTGQLFYSIDGGLRWKLITNAIAGSDTSYGWIPEVKRTKTNCKVKLIYKDGTGKKVVGTAKSPGKFSVIVP